MMLGDPMTAAGYYVYKSLFFEVSRETLLNLSEYLAMTEPNAPLRELSREMADQSLDLELEYNRLCVGPYRLQAPPYESVYRGPSRETFTRITQEVEAHYQQLGLMGQRASGEPADFFGNELEYLFVLYSKYQQETGDKAPWAARIDAFLSEHLGQWYTAFLDDIANHTEMPFWREFSVQLKAFIEPQLATERP